MGSLNPLYPQRGTKGGLGIKAIGLLLSILLFFIFFRTGFPVVDKPLYSEFRPVMGTLAEISVASISSKTQKAACQAAWAEIERLEQVFSFHRDDSELNRVNRTASQAPVKVSDDMFHVLQESLIAAEATNGLFDISIGPIIKLYGFYKNSPKNVPDEAEIQEALKKVNYREISLNITNKTIFLMKKGMILDLGGIAKGYSVDRGVEALKGQGISEGLVNIGGNIYAFGHRKWKIGIRDPQNEGKIWKVITLQNEGVSTSGDYERFFIKNHVRVHHIFDPRTGHSATGNISVTVVAKDAFTADTFDTGLFILDSKKAHAVAERYGLKVYLP